MGNGCQPLTEMGPDPPNVEPECGFSHQTNLGFSLTNMEKMME